MGKERPNPDKIEQAARLLDGLERRAAYWVACQLENLARGQKLVADLQRLRELLNDLEVPGLDGERTCPAVGSGRLKRQVFVIGTHKVSLPAGLAALFTMLSAGGWCSAETLKEGVYKWTRRQITPRALVQSIYRLRRELKAGGVKYRIEYGGKHGWRYQPGLTTGLDR